MPEPVQVLDRREQFHLLAVANGVTALAVAGFLWFTFVAWQVSQGLSLLITEATLAGVGGALIASALRLRRTVDPSSRKEIRRSPELRHIRRRVALLVTAEIIGLWVIAGTTIHFRRLDWAPVGIGAIASLHFLPLARLMGIRTYVMTAVAGCLVSASTLVAPDVGLSSLSYLLVGLALVFWMSAAHLLATTRLADVASIG